MIFSDQKLWCLDFFTSMLYKNLSLLCCSVELAIRRWTMNLMMYIDEIQGAREKEIWWLMTASFSFLIQVLPFFSSSSCHIIMLYANNKLKKSEIGEISLFRYFSRFSFSHTNKSSLSSLLPLLCCFSSLPCHQRESHGSNNVGPSPFFDLKY